MAKNRKTESEYVDHRVAANDDGGFDVLGVVDEETTEVVSTHATVDEAIKALP